jgi:hypothetical protein
MSVILQRYSVTIYGVCIGSRIYWALQQLVRLHLARRLVFSVTAFTVRVSLYPGLPTVLGLSY